MIKYIIPGAIGFALGFKTAEWFLDIVTKIDAMGAKSHMSYTATTFGIKPGVDWSDKRTEDFYNKVIARLGIDQKVRERCKEIQEQVRAEQEKLG